VKETGEGGGRGGRIGARRKEQRRNGREMSRWGKERKECGVKDEKKGNVRNGQKARWGKGE